MADNDFESFRPEAASNFNEFAPEREVGAGEGVIRTLKGAGHRVLAAGAMAAGGLFSAGGLADNSVSESLFRAADAEAANAAATDLQPNEHAGILTKGAQFVAGIPAGIVEAPTLPFQMGQQVTQARGSTGQALTAAALSLPATAIQALAPEFGGRVASRLFESGVKRYVAKAAGGAAASVAGGPAGRAVQNLGLPDTMQQDVAPNLQDVAAGAGFGLLARGHVAPHQAAGNVVHAAVKALGGSDAFASTISINATAHAKAEGVAPHLGVHADAAVDGLKDDDLQALSQRYADMRAAGMSEVETRGALKAALQDKLSDLGGDGEGGDEQATANALGGEEGEAWGALPKAVRTSLDDELAGLQDDLGAAKTDVAKAHVQKQIEDVQKRMHAKAAAKDFRDMAAAAGKRQDWKRRAEYLQQADKLDPPEKPAAKSKPAGTGIEPYAYHVPETGFSVDDQGRARGMPSPDAPESGTVDSTATSQEALPAPPVRLALPFIPNWRRWTPALPAPGDAPVRVTPEGQAMAPGSQMYWPTEKPFDMPDAAAQHPAYSHAYPEDFHKAAEAVGLPVNEMVARTSDALTHLLELDPAHADLLGRTNLSIPELYHAALSRVAEIYRREGAGAGKELPHGDQAQAPDVEVGEGSPEAAEAGPVAQDPLEADRARVAEERARQRPGSTATVHEGVTPPPGFDVTDSVGLAGGKSLDGKRGFISRMIPPTIQVADRTGKMVTVPVWEEIAAHEHAEHPNIAKKGYDKAHDEDGNAATARFLERFNVDPRAYQNALRPHIKAAELDALQHPENVPPELDHRPYAKPFAKADNTHQLGEQHPWNRLHAGKKPVSARDTARAAALKEHENGQLIHPAGTASAGGEGAGAVRPEEKAPEPAAPAPRDSDAPADAGVEAKAPTAQEPSPPPAEPGRDFSKMSDDKLRSYARGFGLKDTAKRPRAELEAELRQKQGGAKREVGDIDFQRTDSPRHGMLADGVRKIAAHVTRLWRNAPRVEVLENFDQAHPEVRARDTAQREGGASGEPAAWLHNGTIYINAKAMRDTRHVISAIFHEGVGHYGLRGVFGEHLNGVLDALAHSEPDRIRERAEKYGLDPSKESDRRTAASEMLAHLAEKNPSLPPVRAALAGIRGWLRKNMPGFRGMKFSDDELVRSFIDPARRWVESGRKIEGSEPGKVSDIADARAKRDAATQEATPQVFQDHAEGGDATANEAAFMRDDDKPGAIAAKMNVASSYVGKAFGKVMGGQTNVSRQLGQQGLRAALANSIRADARARFMLKDIRNYADRLLGKDPKVVRAVNLAWESGKPVADPRLRAFFQTAKTYGDKMVDQVRLTGKEMGYIENYLHHLYKDPKRAAGVFHNYVQNSPLRSGGFTKERFHETLEHARASGLEPVSENPVDLFLAHWSQMHKYVEMAKFKDHLQAHGLLQDDPGRYRAPPGWGRINDPLFQGKIAPEGVAKDINNHTAQGLYKFPVWQGFRAAQNLLLGLKLTASLYHGAMTTGDSIVSHSSIGFQRMLMGDMKGAATSLAHAAKALPQAGADLIGKGAGSKLVEQYLGIKPTDPTTGLIFDKLTRGGARVFMEKSDTNDAITQFHRAMMQGKYTTAAAKAFGAGVEAMTWHIAHKLVPAQKMLARVALFKLHLDRHAERLGAQRGDYSGIINKMNPDFVDKIAAEVNDSVDDRLGQFAYDNLFMNRMARDAMAATIQSPGWNIGSGRLIFGGLADLRKIVRPDAPSIPLDKAGKITDVSGPRLTSRLAYLMTMNAVMMTFNGMMTALLTGEAPSGKDWFFFRTGAKNRDGSDERMQYPSYQRDEWGLTHTPVQMVEDKMHPMLSMATQLWKNHDYYGDQIANKSDNWNTQAKQYLSYLGKNLTPYAAQNVQRNEQAGGGLGRDVLPFLGITPAPAHVTRSDFQQHVMAATERQPHIAGRTPEQVQRAHMLSDSINKVRSGDRSVLSTLSPQDRQTVLKDSKQDIIVYRFKQLPLTEQIEALDKATPEEQKKYGLRQIMQSHLLSKRGQAELKAMQDPEDAKAIRDRIHSIQRPQAA